MTWPGRGPRSSGGEASADSPEEARHQSPRLGDDPRRLAGVAVAVAVAGLWLLGHGNGGLTHDAPLYALQVLAHLDPASYADDLFLAHGSQDQFSLFSRVAAPLVRSLGLPAAFHAVALGGALLWLGAALLLAWRLTEDRWSFRCAAILLVSVMPDYGGLGVFEIGRHLATPRILSEALALLGLLCWIDGRSRKGGGPSGGLLLAASAVLLSSSAALHPLMAAPVCALVVLEVLVTRRSVLWWGAALVGAAVALWIGATWVLELDPLARFDSAWWSVVTARSPHLLVTSWSAGDWSRLALLLALAAATWRVGRGWARRLAGLSAVVAVGGVLLNLVGVDLGHNVAASQLQLFRMVWPLHVLAPIFAASLVVETCRSHRSGWPAAVALAALALALVSVGVQAMLMIVVGPLAVAWLVWARGGDHAPPPWCQGVGWGLALLALAFRVFADLQLAGSQQAVVGNGPGYTLYVIAGALVLFLGVAAVGATLLRGRWVATVLLAAGLGAIAVGLAFHDQRGNFTLAVESGLGSEGLRGMVPKGRSAYWQGEPLGSWILLGTSNYFSWTQGAGVVFSRETALEFERRWRLLGHMAEDRGVAHPTTEDDPLGGDPWWRLRNICWEDPELHTIAIRHELPKAPVAVWPPDQPLDPALRFTAEETFFLYRCEDL